MDGFRNRAAPVLIAGDPAGAHVRIDATGIYVYNSAGTLVTRLTIGAGFTALNNDFLLANHLRLPSDTGFPGGGPIRIQLDPNEDGVDAARLFIPDTDGLDFWPVDNTPDAVPPLTVRSFPLMVAQHGSFLVPVVAGGGAVDGTLTYTKAFPAGTVPDILFTTQGTGAVAPICCTRTATPGNASCTWRLYPMGGAGTWPTTGNIAVWWAAAYR